jgi:YegS/Rv2252/BmrU family lipid kinase
MPVSLIINPRAAGGAAARHLPHILRALDHAQLRYEVLHTERRGDATRLAIQARETGASVIGVIGGDGTLSEVSQAYIDANGRPLAGPPLALLPAGTGGDFSRMLAPDEPTSLRRALARLIKGNTREIDLGVLTLTGPNGESVRRAFINIASFGISGEIDETVSRGPKWIGGKAAFFVATVSSMLSYRNIPVEVTLDGEPWYRGPTFVTAIANGRFFGGGMQIAPSAELDDGLFDVVCLADLDRSTALSLSAKVYRGGHIGARGIETRQARRVEARTLRATDRVLLDVDGETPGYLPLVAELLPKALKVVVD